MRTTLIARGAAVAAAAAMVALSAAPASAATVSQASATALSLELAGTGARDTGTYAVTNDGSTQSSEGMNEPAFAALGGQDAIHTGTLAQDAVASKNATSAACAGLAGDGATLVAAGSGDCLSGGDNVDLTAASLNADAFKNVVSSDLFQGFDKQLQDQLLGALGDSPADLSDAFQDAIAPVVAAFGDPRLRVDFGAVQSNCVADKDSASGDSTLADAGIYVSGFGQDVQIAEIPVKPGVNQKVVTDLSGVSASILDSVETNLKQSMDGAAAPLADLSDQLQAQVLDQALSQISEQLVPLEENVLDITLNQQRTAPGEITVTALHAKVLPAAEQFVGASLVDLSIGTSHCGPNSPVAKANPRVPAKNPPADVPTVVTAGMESYDDGSAGRTALVTLLLLAAAGAGVATYVRMLRRG